MQGNTWRRSPVLINERPSQIPGRYGYVPHELLKAHKEISAPAYRMLLFFVVNRTGFYLNGSIVSEYTGIRANKISFYRQELCEKGFILYADGSITVNWSAIIGGGEDDSSEETEGVSAEVEMPSVAPKNTDVAPARDIGVPPLGAHNNIYNTDNNKEADRRRKTAIRMAEKRKNERIANLTNSELSVVFRLDDAKTNRTDSSAIPLPGEADNGKE